MAAWTFDAARYVEDVVRPVQRGWPPTANLFRVYQVRPAAGQSEVDIALTEMPHCWGRPELRAYGSGCERLRAGHTGAVALLRDGDRRAAHRVAVEADLDKLAAVVRHRLHGAPAMPASAVDELVQAGAHRWTRRDVLGALDLAGATERDPAGLSAVPEPKRWKQLRDCLTDLPYRNLWDFLTCAPGLAGVETTAVQTEARRQRLRVSRDRAATAETTLLALVRRWLDEPGGLAAVLRHELLADLAAETLHGYGAVRAMAAADPDRCAAAGAPTGPDALAYPVWCARPGVAPTWITRYTDAIAERRLTAALAVLDAHPLPTEWRTVRDGLRATVARLAEDLATAREREESAVEDAAAGYLAVGRAMSTPDVAAGLLRCRAAAPGEVTVRVDGERVLVCWTASPSTAGRIGYRVTRGATPVAEDTVDLTVTDTPPVATPVVYTVTATRDGVPGAAVASAEVAVLPEVADLALNPVPGMVAGRWRLPAAAIGAVVTRTDPEGATVELTDAEPEGFADHDVRPDTAYTYRVRAEYPAMCSPGVTASAVPPDVPRPVTDLCADIDESTVDLSWSGRSAGHVEFRLPRKGTAAPWGIVPLARTDILGPVVGLATASPARIDLADLAGERVLVPVTVRGAWAAVGDAVTLDLPLAPVTGLHAEQIGPQVRLCWEWPEWAHDARVVWRADAEPEGPTDPLAAVFDTTRIAYLSLGVRVRMAGPGKYWFGVCVCDRGRFGPLATVGLPVRPEVGYTVRRVPWFRAGTHVVSVQGPPPLPDLALVAKSGARPLALDDGEELLRLPGGATTGAEHTLSVPDRLTRPVHLRAFALDAEVLLRHPDPRDLVVR